MQIEIDNLFFSYEEVSVLQRVRLHILRGEFIGIMGPNGGGKTTLLKLLMGFLQPTSGSVKVKGKIGYVPQVHRTDRDFPIAVGELVMLGALSKATFWGTYPAAVKEKANALIDRLGLTAHKHKVFGSLSGGLAQRALLARALLSDPDILLLDEPTANIDAASIRVIFEILEELKGKRTILLVTHDLKTIIERVDRVLCVQGELSSILPKDVCEHFALGLYHAPLLSYPTNNPKKKEEMLSPFIDNPFIQMALWACMLASFASGVIGSFVVIKRISFIAGSIAHSILGGMGCCLWLQRCYHLAWCEPIYGAFSSAIGSALLLGWVHLNYRQREDAIIAAIWSTGMAIGMIFLSLTPGTNVELLNFLFGNILFIDSVDLVRLAILNGVILAVVAFYYRRFLALCFDEEQALLQGISVRGLYFLLLSLVAVSIVLLMQIIGIILVIALLTIPATLASLFTHRLIVMMGAAFAFCAFFSLLGLGVSFTLNWPPGATIALLSAVFYLVLLPLKKKKFSLRLTNRAPLE